MMKKINNLFEVNNQDTIGTALLKGATKGYIQGALAAGLGLGILAIGVFALSNDEESTEEEEKIEEDLEDTPETVRQGAYSPYRCPVV